MNERQQEIASAVPANLDDLPRLRGFRLRGMEMTRLETFIDAAFAFGLIAISAVILFLYVRAWQLCEPLRLNARERLMTRGELEGWSIPVSVGIVSLVFSFTLPIEQIAWCGWVYFLMAILVRVHRFLHKRRLEAVSAGSAKG